MITAESAAPHFIDCIFRNNSALNGAAVMGSGYAVPRFSDCLFEHNQATGEGSHGGALYISFYSEPLFERCTFAGNSAGSFGGDFYCYLQCVPVFESCSFIGSAAPQASCLYNNLTSIPQLDNCLIAFGSGGDPIYSPDETAPLLRCCNIYGNEGGDWIELIEDQYGQEGNISADPLFCDSLGGDYRLHTDSPCLPGVNPDCGLIGAHPVGCPTSDIPQDPFDPQAPEEGGTGDDGGARLALTVAPNPSAAATRISYRVPAGLAGQRLELRLLAADGRLVRHLLAAPARAGAGQLAWDLRDDRGRLVPGGIYFCHLRIAGQSRLLRAVLVR
ncbi:MAG: hypothetical protein GF330_05070 [Candidatus Eisenbacteria bacterium]|nr:hypothetical protein [Candidatus Eisenbacteria bacterium]